MRSTMLQALRVLTALVVATSTALALSALPAAAAIQTPEPSPDQLNQRLPGEMTPREIDAALASCPDPTNAQDGSGRYNIIDEMTPQRVLLRTGTPSWGLTHIKKRYYEGATNHEWTSYAKDLWRDAYTAQLWYEKSECYYIMRYNYATPGGEIRTMCVYFDFKAYGGKGSRGVANAYWIKGIPACPGVS